MSEMIGAAIGIGIGGVLAIFILLKICSTRPILNTIFILLACVGLMVTSFAMPVNSSGESSDLNGIWIIGQAICLFLIIVLACAEFAFEEEEYVEHEGYIDYKGDFRGTSKLAKKSMFWSTLGGALATSAVLTGINYAIFDSGIGLGVLGALATAFIIFITVKHWVKRFRKRKSFY